MNNNTMTDQEVNELIVQAIDFMCKKFNDEELDFIADVYKDSLKHCQTMRLKFLEKVEELEKIKGEEKDGK